MADVDWAGMWMNREQFISRLGARHDVLVGSGARRLWQLRSRRSVNSTTEKPETPEGVRMDKSPPWLVDVQRWPLHQLALALNGARYRRNLRARPGSFIGLLFHPTYWRDLKAARPGVTAYHVYDYYRNMPGWNFRLEREDRDLLARADLVTASSRRLARFLEDISERDVTFLPNGVDYERFGRQPDSEPIDLAEVPRPRIGYTGRLNRKIDFELIYRLATSRQEWNFVMVGPVAHLDDVSQGWYRRCLGLPNVWFLGSKRPEELPGYVWGMDVNILCYARREELWVDWGYPLKLHEYLATGQPVVSADLDSVREFSEIVRIVSQSPDEWLTALEEALGEVDRESALARMAVAASNSWGNRVDLLEARMSEVWSC